MCKKNVHFLIEPARLQKCVVTRLGLSRHERLGMRDRGMMESHLRDHRTKKMNLEPCPLYPLTQIDLRIISSAVQRGQACLPLTTWEGRIRFLLIRALTFKPHTALCRQGQMLNDPTPSRDPYARGQSSIISKVLIAGSPSGQLQICIASAVFEYDGNVNNSCD